jgi:hypothetical protein
MTPGQIYHTQEFAASLGRVELQGSRRSNRSVGSTRLPSPETFTVPFESESPERMYQLRYTSKYWLVPIDGADRLDTLAVER